MQYLAALQKRKSAKVDNIPAKLVQADRETMSDGLTEICNKIRLGPELEDGHGVNYIEI
ncbi:MAG: hypothetical protein AB2693_11640 [Candidatus Thiodiazotropha sp.]